MKEIKSSSIEEIERVYWIDDEYISKVVINYKKPWNLMKVRM